MKLLKNHEYKSIESLLQNYKFNNNPTHEYSQAFEEIIKFFDKNPYKDFLNIYYLNRHNYKNRYPTSRKIFNYLEKKLYVEEPTLYVIRKDIIYKSAMIFYKYDIL